MKMKLHIVQSVLAATLVLSATTAGAHDPREFDRMMDQPKPVPTTCLELADIRNFSTDVTNPDVAALKAHCDAGKQAADKKAAGSTKKPAPAKTR
ncbi:MAG: hypothetical protein WC213_08280 [Arenimonas sp.]|jgi:hypothetical protein